MATPQQQQAQQQQQPQPPHPQQPQPPQPPQPQPNRPPTTADALHKLRQAEQKTLSALHHASAAFRALSTVDAAQAQAFNTHAEAFLKLLHDAQTLVRDRVRHVGMDLPFENVTQRRLIESDLAVQRTAHLHRALAATLAALAEPAVPDAAAPSPPYMPSPAASTPLNVMNAGPGVAATPAASAMVAPSPQNAPITIAVPTPDHQPLPHPPPPHLAPPVHPGVQGAPALNGAPGDADLPDGQDMQDVVSAPP